LIRLSSVDKYALKFDSVYACIILGYRKTLFLFAYQRKRWQLSHLIQEI
jgi:hypothetical protein